MLQIEISETYADILKPLQTHVDEALRRYALEQVQQKLLESEQHVQVWEQKYGCTYDLFVYRTATDPDYVAQLNQNEETQLWESDLIAWEFDVKDWQTWRHHLQSLSITTSL